MKASCSFRATGCNRVAACLDWCADGRIAYGTANAVAIYNPQTGQLEQRLQGHSDRVNCVSWIRPAGDLRFDVDIQVLISGAADKSVLIWVLQHSSATAWMLAKALQAHSLPVTGIATSLGANGTVTLVSIAGTDEPHIWSGSVAGQGADAWQQSEWTLGQKLHGCAAVQHAVTLTTLPAQTGWHMLALGGVDNVIRIFTRPAGGMFQAACKLAGHGDWVRTLAFYAVPEHQNASHRSDLRMLLASGSQDRYIRIWSISTDQQMQDRLQSGHTSTCEIARYAPRQTFTTGDDSWSVVLEALLIGHEDWVHSLAWQPNLSPGQRPCLLSAAMDRTMMLWRPDKSTGLWMSEESVGDAGPQSLGYYTCAWSPDAASIIAHGYTGALHQWQRSGQGMWVPHQALGGHYGPVVDMCWALHGACLFTASEDQTARIFSEFQGGWCEIARPQVHGHDLSCLACLPAEPQQESRVLYASGSEEKVLRVLEAPQAFLDTLALAQGRAASQYTPSQANSEAEDRALGASVAALGLSNKAIYASTAASQHHAANGTVGADAYTEGPDLAPSAAPAAAAEPPLEEHLAQSTLWPEIIKLYGHGNDLFCVAADPQGRYFASACKSQSLEFASIFLWDVCNWTPAAQLEAHTLTVTQLAFSPDGSHLVSVSRDRSFAVFQRQEQGPPFRLLARVQKAHARILWAATWAPNGDHFATGSRDGTVKIWALTSLSAGEAQPRPSRTLPPFKSSVTALAWASAPAADIASTTTYLAVGMEDGRLEVWQNSDQQCFLLWQASQHLRHCAAVKRLAWRPAPAPGLNHSSLQLASCGNDHCVMVLTLTLE